MAAVAYHFDAKAKGRSEGASAINSAAYITADQIHDERLGKTFNYSRKTGVELVYHAAPKDAPEWAHDFKQAWNKAEEADTKINATVARGYIASLPYPLSKEQREYIVKDFIREQFTRKGFMATAAIHEPDKDGDHRNYHVHILFSERKLDAKGFEKVKDRRFSAFASRKIELEKLKIKWAELGARQLDKAGFPLEAARWRHGYKEKNEQADLAEVRGDQAYAEDCRSAEATRHEGPHIRGMKARGVVSEVSKSREERAEAYRAKREKLAALRAAVAALEKEAAALSDEPMPKPNNDNHSDADEPLYKKFRRERNGKVHGIKGKSTRQMADEYLHLCRNPMQDLQGFIHADKSGVDHHGRYRRYKTGSPRTFADPTLRFYKNPLYDVRSRVGKNGQRVGVNNLLSSGSRTRLGQNDLLRSLRNAAIPLTTRLIKPPRKKARTAQQKEEFKAEAKRLAKARRIKKLKPKIRPPNENTARPLQPGRPKDMTRGELYAFHKRNGTLALYYQMYPDDAPEQ